MSSVGGAVAMDERSTPARIRDAAIARIAATGPTDTTVRSIAEQAEVSPALVIHHFDSMENLRRICDEHVVGVIRQAKSAAMSSGNLDPLAAARTGSTELPVLAYLARTLTEGTPHVADLVREMVDDAVGYLTAGQESGVIGHVADLRASATVLIVWSLGAVVLHEHVRALLGVDLLRPDLMAAPEAIRAYHLPALDLLAGGLIPGDVHRQMRAAMTETMPHDSPPRTSEEGQP